MFQAKRGYRSISVRTYVFDKLIDIAQRESLSSAANGWINLKDLVQDDCIKAVYTIKPCSIEVLEPKEEVEYELMKMKGIKNSAE